MTNVCQSLSNYLNDFNEQIAYTHIEYVSASCQRKFLTFQYLQPPLDGHYLMIRPYDVNHMKHHIALKTELSAYKTVTSNFAPFIDVLLYLFEIINIYVYGWFNGSTFAYSSS